MHVGTEHRVCAPLLDWWNNSRQWCQKRKLSFNKGPSNLSGTWSLYTASLSCQRRLLRVPCTARISNQSILKEINPGCSLEGLMLKLKLQYFGHLMRRVDSLEKTLMLGGIGGRRRRGWQRMRWLDGITDSMDMSFSEFRELVMNRGPGVLQFMGSQRVGHDWATELNWMIIRFQIYTLLLDSHLLALHLQLLATWVFSLCIQLIRSECFYWRMINFLQTHSPMSIPVSVQ